MRKKWKCKTRNSTAILKIIFTQMIICFMILISIIVYSRISKVGISSVQNTLYGTNNLKGLISIFGNQISKTEETSNRPDIKKIIEETKMGTSSFVSKTMSNPFENASLPINGNITSEFGFRQNPFNAENEFHSGVDISAEMETNVLCVFDGKIIESEYSPIGGNYMRIQHENGFVTYYGHLYEPLKVVGDYVKTNDIIAKSGSSGKTTGPHLHFQIEYNNRSVNPNEYFNFNKK